MKITRLRVTALRPRIGIGAITLFAMLALAFSNLDIGTFFISPAKAQSAQPRQFAITIKQRKVISGPNVIRVTEGDSVEIVLTGDEQAELHLHGYDIMLSLTPNVPGKIAFNAKIGGRFPLEAHRFGSGAHTSNYHAGRPLLYVEVHPR
jgi:hypothetical protein